MVCSAIATRTLKKMFTITLNNVLQRKCVFSSVSVITDWPLNF